MQNRSGAFIALALALSFIAISFETRARVNFDSSGVASDTPTLNSTYAGGTTTVNSTYFLTFAPVGTPTTSPRNFDFTYYVVNADNTLTPVYYSYTKPVATGLGNGPVRTTRLDASLLSSDIVTHFSGSFDNSPTNTKNGGAIHSNGGSIGDITGDFIGNYATVSSSNTATGGAIYTINGSIGQITGDFIGNYASGTGFLSSYARGGAINNTGIITGIAGDFIGNYASTGLFAAAAGGAIYNSGASANIGTIAGDFIGNYVNSSSGSLGGAIYNGDNAVIQSISGKFVNNYNAHNGGAIYNTSARIESIEGLFNGNSARTSGGGVYNNTGGVIAAIDADFIGNSSITSGGAIYNTNGTIGSVTGNFIGNSAATGGGVYNNTGGVLTVLGGSSFIRNAATGNGGAIYNIGTLILTSGSSDILFSDNSAGGIGHDIYNTGTVRIDGNAGNVVLGGGIAGTSASVINKLNAGTLVIDGDSSGFTGIFTQTGGTTFVNDQFFAGISRINGGLLQGAIDHALFPTAQINLNNARWNMMGDSDISNLSLDNGAVIDMRASVPNIYNTLSVMNYDAADGVVMMNTALGADNSPTDKIVIKTGGGATGTTMLYVNTFGFGAPTIDGIKLVDAGGSAIAPDAFALNGDQVDNGAYIYRLFQGDASGTDTHSFFLRNTMQMTALSRTMANMPAIHLNIVKTGMNSLRKRLGELRDSDPNAAGGVWARAYAKNLDVNDTIDSRMNLYGAESGIDVQINCDKCRNPVFMGVMAGYEYTNNIKTRQGNGFDGFGLGHMPSVGAYATWMNENGWYADVTTRWFWSQMKLSAITAQGDAISFKPDRDFVTGSFEFGRQFDWEINCSSKIVFEPKAEFQYAYARSKSFNIDGNGVLRYGHTQSIMPRAGVKIGYDKVFGNGWVIQPFFEAMVSEELDGETEINYANAPFKSDLGGTVYELAIGMNAQVYRRMAAYVDLTFETGAVYQSIGGNVGVRYNF